MTFTPGLTGNERAIALGIDLRISRSKLRTLQAFYVEQVELNDLLSDEELTVTVPVGTSIRDLRNPSRKIKVIASREGDPVEISEQALQKGEVISVEEEKPQGIGTLGIVFLSLNVSVVMVLLAIWGFRQRRTAKHHNR